MENPDYKVVVTVDGAEAASEKLNELCQLLEKAKSLADDLAISLGNLSIKF